MPHLKLAVTALFVVLAAAIGGLMAGYWVLVLEPRLVAEAQDQAQILAESQASALAPALTATDDDRSRRVIEAMDQVLLLRDERTGEPYFLSIQLETDPAVTHDMPGSLDLGRGNFDDVAAFPTDVALYDPQTDELLGIASIRVSRRFFDTFSHDVKRHLVLQSGAVVLVLLLTCALLVVLIAKLQAQTSEKGRIERELASQARKYRRLLDSLSNYFVYSLDAAGRLDFVSDSVTRVLGYTPDEFARSYESYLTDTTTNAVSRQRPPLGAAASGERSYELAIRASDGDIHRLEHSEVAVVSETGAPLGMDGIARDVTAQRRLERELRAAKEDAEAASVAKSQFLANVSHEVRTPLNAVIGMTALALKTELTPQQANYLTKAQGSARLLLELINDILDLSKIEAGKLELQCVPFELDDVLTDIASIVGYRAGEKGLEVFFAAARDLPRTLEGDPLRLGQVLLNLTNNAIKFTEKGEIVVATEVVERTGNDVVLKFSVRDTGIGIADGVMSQLFQPFTQADASTTRQYGGTGLGLAISKRLVELMGGQITVDSQPGRGSVFSFTARLKASARETATPSAMRAQLRGLPVLVVDDNETARAVFHEILTSFSAAVTCVASGERALEQVRRAAARGVPYRLVIVDWRMPGIDGIETVRRLRGSEDLGQQPGTILVTAYGRDDVVNEAKRAGADVFISKPVSPSALFDAVVEALSAHEPQFQVVARADRRVETSFAVTSRVLLVEDNPINREVARELLGAAGIRVTEAKNGADALRRLETEAFDVVLMDVQMPEMDGMEATARIRKDPKWHDLPIVAMTAHAMAGDRERFLAAGMSDYVAKPIEEAELLGVLSRWLEPARATSAASAPAQADAIPRLPGVEVSAALLRIGGRVQLYRRLLVDFREQNRTAMIRAREDWRRGNRQAVRMFAHALRGVAGAIGADGVAAAAGDLERAADKGGDCESPLAALERTLVPVLAGLESVVATSAAPEPELAVDGNGGDDGAGAGDLAALRPALTELAAQVESNSLSARKAAADVTQRFRGSRFRPQLDVVQASLQALDFDAAREHLYRVMAELDGEAS